MKPTAQETLAIIALLILGGLGAGLLYVPIPPSNATTIAVIVGALASAITIAGGQKLADRLTQSTGPDATITTESPKP